jgi:cell division protein FtsB
MTAAHLSAPSDPPARPRRAKGLRLPGSRGGMAWLAVLVIIGTLLAVQFGRQVYANWEIGRQAAEIEAEIAAIQARNAELQAELDYVESDAFISAEARRLSNVGSAGEKALIIPAGAEAPLPEELTTTASQAPLLQQWVELFFGPSDPG